MKNNFGRFCFLIFLTVSLTLPFLAMAISPGSLPGASDLGIPASPINEASGLLKAVANVVKWVYIIFFIIAVLFIILAAYNYLVKSGEPEKIKDIHKQLTYAAVAIVVALLAVGAQVIIKNFLEQGGGGSSGYQLQSPSQLQVPERTYQSPYLQVPGVTPPSPQPLPQPHLNVPGINSSF